MNAGRVRLAAVLGIFLAVLREIFDESAYSRFLTGEGIQASVASYSEFLKQHEAAKARRPKCC